MAFDLDRIDGTSALSLLQPENVTLQGERATIELQLSASHDIGLYFPAPGGMVEASWLRLAADVLAHLRTIDNQVQRVSAAQWARSSHPPSYYEGELAYIDLTDTAAILGYYVIGCNAEWEERFVRTETGWMRLSDSP